MSSITIGDRIIDTERTPLLIAGPCALEDMDDALLIAARCRDEAQRHGFAYVFKSSYLKDNRSSVESYTGPGLERGLEMLERVGREVGVPLLTDVHCREEIGPVAGVCDVIQIPAFLVRQTRLVVAAAETGRAVNLKKGQFLSPEEMGLAVAKARAGGASEVIVTERGTMFGYHNLVVDFTGFERMRPFGAPVVFDATHSLQLPGGLGDRSGGRPGLARLLARAAAAAGCDGLFVETHPRPLACRCDAEAMLPLAELPVLLAEAARFFEAAGACRAGGGEETV
ncbi:MAG: 3-deoxy-8-phosphooctulonate synthase [Candidatus Krumholzibacteriota bacterium]|nr:3-deoxy-8-phosphooctulonate synthase [Candidatus Krumholzibacteriota bacterium]